MDTLRPLRSSDLPLYRSWFSDPETKRRVSPPDDLWCAHVLAGGGSACWVLEDEGALGGVLQADWNEVGHAFVSIVVDPARRGRSLATRLLRAFLAHQGQGFAMVTASVEPDNLTSLRLALRCGLEMAGVDEEGLVRLHLVRSRANEG